MPMAAIHTYQNLGVDQKLTHLQSQAPRRLAPAPVDPSRCKKKSYLHQPYPTQPASVARRNARERNRVKQVNNGFAALPPSFVSESSAGPSCHDAYDSYEPMSPEDEELLDVISWWQQQ
uniref:SFRICE_028265 n=1 Tax=Spodoptera frugiperda TaxID=7108 RepID=A0A2H1V1B3_SPOFR